MPNKPDANMSAWEKANEDLAKARKKREAERGTSKTTNPLMADFKTRMEKREMEKAKEELKTEKKAARKGGRKYGSKAMGAKDTARNFSGDGEGQGYTSKTKVDGSAMRDKPMSKANLDYYKDAQNKKAKASKSDQPKKAPRRRPTGREEMIAQRYMDNEKRKKDGGSPVVGG